MSMFIFLHYQYTNYFLINKSKTTFIKVFCVYPAQYATSYPIVLAECTLLSGHHTLTEILAVNRNPFIKAFYFSGVRLSGS